MEKANNSQLKNISKIPTYTRSKPRNAGFLLICLYFFSPLGNHFAKIAAIKYT